MDGYSFRSGVGRAAPIGLRHIVRHKGRIVAVDGAGRIKKHGPQVLLDVTDFGGVIPQAVHDELDVTAVQFQEPVSYTHLFCWSAERFSRSERILRSPDA